jgi:hypothetical protein
MRHAGLKITEAHTPDDDDRAAMIVALNRLYGAATQSVQEIVANLSASERAKLAVFCYGHAHMNTIGLAIAATCAREHLITAAHSTTAGSTIFAQSRDRTVATGRPHGRRTPVSLAASACA